MVTHPVSPNLEQSTVMRLLFTFATGTPQQWYCNRRNPPHCQLNHSLVVSTDLRQRHAIRKSLMLLDKLILTSLGSKLPLAKRLRKTRKCAQSKCTIITTDFVSRYCSSHQACKQQVTKSTKMERSLPNITFWADHSM